jgi:Tol biopolymer transport system component
MVATCSASDPYTITFFDLAAKTQEKTDAPAASPAISPDGKRVAFDLNGDIGVYDRASKAKKMLTDNEHVEVYPAFSADGKTVYFESRAQDPNYERREVSVVASVSVP